jgi:HNH endonuclease
MSETPLQRIIEDLTRFLQDTSYTEARGVPEPIVPSDSQAVLLIRQIRNRYRPHVAVLISIFVPECLSCKHFEQQWLEPTPIESALIFPENWTRSYLELGIPRKKTQEVSQALDNGSWRGPSCYYCGSIMRLDMKNGLGFYIKTLPLSSFYSANRDNRKQPPKWMRKIVFEAYGRKCARCNSMMTFQQAISHHIAPLSSGKETDMENLQLLCHPCHAKKKNQNVDYAIHPSLHFPLLPPSDTSSML